MESMAECLHRIHQHGVAHHDIAPRNVMFVDNSAIFVDFALSEDADSPKILYDGNSFIPFFKELGVQQYLLMECLQKAKLESKDWTNMFDGVQFHDERNPVTPSEKDRRELEMVESDDYRMGLDAIWDLVGKSDTREHILVGLQGLRTRFEGNNAMIASLDSFCDTYMFPYPSSGQ